jgi:hypothetical protein
MRNKSGKCFAIKNAQRARENKVCCTKSPVRKILEKFLN